MNWLLICVIGILVVCALEGYFRGFIKIVFSLLAMIITLAVVSVAAPKITTYIEENTELDERITEKCLEHVEKNAQDRLDREAQEKSEETRQQLEENGISGGELDALMDKREVMRSIRHWQIAEFIRQWHKKSRILSSA